MIPATFLIVLTVSGLGQALIFDFTFVWYEINSTVPHKYLAKNELPESVVNASKILVDHKIPVLLRRFDVSFAKKLDTLSLSECQINDIETGSFSSVPALKNLTLSRNNIKLIRNDVFNTLDIVYLDLSHNKITTIKPNAFDNMPNLTTLNLDYNELTSYAIWFQGCSRLASISVQYNFIQYLPEDIFKNQLNMNLSIYFSYNKISKIHQDLFQVREYKDLYLDHNELHDFNHVLNKIDTLNLNKNDIECLSKELVQNQMSKVKRVLFYDNPVNCSCYEDLVKVKNVLVARPDNC